MSDHPKVPHLKTNEEDSFIAIPCNQEKFAEFISNLLGKQQEISKKFIGTICLKFSDIENFYHLIEQRVHEQQSAYLVQFESVVRYTDGSSVKLGSLEALKTYAEVRPLICRGVSLTWVYLVNFPNKAAQERQTINIDMMVGSKSRFTIIEHNSDLFGSEFKGMKFSQTWVIVVSINHTARSWGTDMENLITGHMENFMSNPDGKVRSFARKNCKFISIITFAILALTFLFFGIKLLGFWSKNVSDRYQTIPNLNPFESLVLKVDFIADSIGSGENLMVLMGCIFYIFVAILFSALIQGLVERGVSRPRPSFILLSRASEEKMKEVMESYERSWLIVIFIFTMNAIAGVVGNIIFGLIS